MTFTQKDREFMTIALEEAGKALAQGDYPVGAVLVADDEVIAKGNNSLNSTKRRIAHAEMNIIMEHTETIMQRDEEGEYISLYSTLEPCLMCLGTAVLHRIKRIVYACPDPDGGAVENITREKKGYYARRWPVIEGGLFVKESKGLLLQFLRKQTSDGWKEVLRNIEKVEE